MEIEINLTYIILAIVICIFIFLFHNGFSLNLFSKHDNGIIDKFLNKYPDVSPEFMKRNLREQNIENNQEIHAINQKFDKNDKDIQEIKETLDKIIQIIEEMQK